jgi:hypothetical protein
MLSGGIIMSEPSQERSAALRERIERYLAWCDSPEFEPCPRCDGKGYHHGFGEHGHDPDWCLSCGGPGEQPTEPGTWSPDDLLREAAASLSPQPAPEASLWRSAFEAGFAWCSSGTDKFGEYNGGPIEDGYAQWEAVLPQPAPAPQKGEQEISDPMTNPTSPGGAGEALAKKLETEADELQAHRARRDLIDLLREAAALLTEQSRQQEAWQPIETAPKDEVRLILFNPDEHGEYMGSWSVQTGAYYEQLGGWQYDGESVAYGNAHQPSHWMPLPAPPQPKEPR